MKFIKRRWRAIGNMLGGSPRYFKKSPSNILQYAAIRSAITRFASGTLLDVGAGRSIYRHLIPDSVEYRTMDFEATEHEYQKEHPLDIVGDVQDIPSTDNAYDTILCTEVLEHVPRPHDAAREMVRILRPGGLIIVTVPFLGYYHDEPYDFYRYTSHGLRSLFENAGATVVEQSGLGGLFSFLGYIRSTVLLSLTYRIPIVWTVTFWLNYLLSHIDVALDRLTLNGKIMPLTNIIILKKTK